MAHNCASWSIPTKRNCNPALVPYIEIQSARGQRARWHLIEVTGAKSNLELRRRRTIPFRAINRRGSPGYDPGLQRHHILPRQLLRSRCFRPLLEALGRDRLCFEDFRANGLLLPAWDEAALRTRLPLHRGPHRDYNQLVFERFGEIEHSWSGLRHRAPEVALIEAHHRLSLLQQALRRQLLDQRSRMTLNRRDPLGEGVDFTELDAMATAMWPATQSPV